MRASPLAESGRPDVMPDSQVEHQREGAPPARPVIAALLVLVGYAGLTLAWTFPLSAHLGSHVFDATARWRGLDWFVESDLYLYLWALAWDAHALVTHPGRIFDANVLYPAAGTLAGSENVFGFLPFSAPIYWATGNPVLAAQTAMLASYVLGAFGLYLLARRWTGVVPALAGGLLYGFAPWRVPSVSALQHLGTHWWPFLVLAVEEYVASGRRVALAGVTASLVASTLTSVYWGYAAFFILGVHLLVRLPALRAEPRRAIGVAAAAGAAGVILLPILLPYVRLRALGVIRAFDPAGLVYPLDLLPRLLRQSGLRPVVLAVIALGVLARIGRRAVVPAAAWMLVLGLAATGALLALGPRLTWIAAGIDVPAPYGILGRVVPGFSSARIPTRFALLASLGAALGAALALEELRGRLRGRTRALVVAALALVLAGDLASRRAPVAAKRMPVGDSVPAVYRHLREHGAGGPLLELPIQGLRAPWYHGRAMYFSTFHWLPLLNGYTGHYPPTFDFLMQRAERLPAADALQEIVDLVDLHWIVVHRGDYLPAGLTAWDAPPAGLEHVGRFETADLYRVTLPPARDLRVRFRGWFEATETLTGTPLRPLRPAEQAGRLDADPGPFAAVAGRALPVTVRAENRSPGTWPAYAVGPRHRVVVRARWLDVDDGAERRVPLPRDLPPGEAVRFTLDVPTNGLRPGPARLELALAQDDRDFASDQAPALRLPVEVREAAR